MKYFIILIFFALMAGCTSKGDKVNTGSLYDLKETCTRDRTKLINSEWRTYEFEHWAQVGNGWKLNARRWAEYECKVGRQNSNFHPPTSRERGSIIR